MRHDPGHEMQTPEALFGWNAGHRAPQSLFESPRDWREMLLKNTHRELSGIGENPSNHWHAVQRVGFEHGRDERLYNLLQARRSARRVQHFYAPMVYRLQPADDHGIDQTFLGLKVIIDRSQIYLRLRGDISQRRRIEAILSKELLCGVEDFRLGSHWRRSHTYVSIVRLFYGGVKYNRKVLPFRLIYHDVSGFRLSGHVFPTQKYSLIRQRLLEERIAEESDFVAPEPATDEDLLRVHDARWIEHLREGTLTHMEESILELPYSASMTRAFWLAAGGTILAARLALKDGIGFHIGGGWHHAYADHGEGFCAINDIAVAIRRMQNDGKIESAMVIDVDNHHGNGTASIFADDPSVFTLSIHQFANYPSFKPPSNLDIDLADGVGDEEYLRLLLAGCHRALEKFSPDLVIYVAGADPYREDQLGGLGLTFGGLMARDRFVFNFLRERKVPVAVTLAGGYAKNVEDTVTIHVNTVKAAAESPPARDKQAKG
jgi:acetoin utilization deacetylase AcuC-like enzyme